MSRNDADAWWYEHRFDLGYERQSEKRTWIVVGLTGVAMLAEIAAGIAFNSMALLADGWHMASHAGALTLSGLAYVFQRRHADNRNFAFGTGKVGSLAGFASAVALGIVAILMVWESLYRLLNPSPIAFVQALVVAVVGLAVNLASAVILGWSRPEHGHGLSQKRGDGTARPETGEDRHHHHHDHNLRAAYLHILADALTSVTAIAALLCGMFLG
jgi:cation diffusion facilitator family transporter